MIFARGRAKKLPFFFNKMQNLLFLHVSGHRFDEFLCCFIHRAEVLTAGCVHVTTATEDLVCELVHRSISLAAERDLRLDLGAAGVGDLMRRDLVLAHEYRVVYVLDLQRHIHYALHIAGLGVEAVHLAAVEGDQGCAVLGEEFHLMVQAVTYQSHAVCIPCIEHTVVDRIFVDAGSEEHRYDAVHLRMTGVVGEVTRVGHHAGIDAGREIGRQAEFAELIGEPEDELAGRGALGVGYLLGLVGADAREVVVNY